MSDQGWTLANFGQSLSDDRQLFAALISTKDRKFKLHASHIAMGKTKLAEQELYPKSQVLQAKLDRRIK